MLCSGIYVWRVPSTFPQIIQIVTQQAYWYPIHFAPLFIEEKLALKVFYLLKIFVVYKLLPSKTKHASIRSCPTTVPINIKYSTWSFYRPFSQCIVSLEGLWSKSNKARIDPQCLCVHENVLIYEHPCTGVVIHSTYPKSQNKVRPCDSAYIQLCHPRDCAAIKDVKSHK